MIFQIRLQSFSNMTLIWGGYQVQCNSKLQKDTFTLRFFIAVEVTKMIGVIVRLDIAAVQVI